MTIRITITDDHPLILSGLETLLSNYPHIEVIATYSSGDELLEALKKEQPDVLLTDLQMPGKVYGIDLIRALRRLYPEVPILILSGQEVVFNVQDVMEQGCKGYLLKNTTNPEMLVRAIETVYKDELYLEPALKDQLLKAVLKARKEKEEMTHLISRREKEILKLIAMGNTSQEMADKLYLSVRTIENHRLRLLQKLEVKNVAGLLSKAAELDLL